MFKNNKCFKKIAIFPGSFSPFHEGHFSVLIKACNLFQKVIIFIGQNEKKEKQNFIKIKKQIEEFINYHKSDLLFHNLSFKKQFIKIVYGNENLIEIANKYHCKWIIRGIRDEKDLKYEQLLANQYKLKNPNIEIIYFLSEKKYSNFRSSNIKNTNRL